MLPPTHLFQFHAYSFMSQCKGHFHAVDQALVITELWELAETSICHGLQNRWWQSENRVERTTKKEAAKPLVADLHLSLRGFYGYLCCILSREQITWMHWRHEFPVSFLETDPTHCSHKKQLLVVLLPVLPNTSSWCCLPEHVTGYMCVRPKMTGESGQAGSHWVTGDPRYALLAGKQSEGCQSAHVLLDAMCYL